MNRILKWFLGEYILHKLKKMKFNIINLFALISNFYMDGKLFYNHSMVFGENSFKKLEARITIQYHGIEKGFLHERFRYRFGEERIKELLKLLKMKNVIENSKKSQIASAYLAMCTYYEKHEFHKIDISDYFPKEDYEIFKGLSTLSYNIVENHTYEQFYKESSEDFIKFSKSRSSIRDFSGEEVPYEIITKVIELTKTAPSVCNRQASKIYYLDNSIQIGRILRLHEGLSGHLDQLSQLLILVTDRSYFCSIGERNQMFIDGGIFLMNLLYALYYYKVGACPAHWAFNKEYDKIIQNELNLTDSEKVLCLIPIGIPKEQYRTTLSLRRENEEILLFVKS